MPRLLLDELSLNFAAPRVGQIDLWDEDLPGFGLRITATGLRTYFVVKRVNGLLVWRSLGRAPPPGTRYGTQLSSNEFWPPAARLEARKMLCELSRGQARSPRKRGKFTANGERL